VLGVRVKLRTGRLEEAQRILEAWRVSEQSEGEHAHPPRMHRETVLLLSLLHSFRGQPDRAFELAQEGVALGERLNSPFITTVAHLRLGHAWQLLPRRNEDNHRDAAIRCYQTGIAMGDQIAVRRVRAEAMWGLVRAYGFLGDLQSAERAAAEGIDIGRWAGDPWIVALIELALGSSLVLAEQWRDALDVLSRVLASFRDCGDSFGRAASRLWLSLTYLQLRQMGRFATCVEDALALCETHGYDFLFLTPTLLGPPDPRCWVPLLIAARDRGHRRAYAVRMLAQIGLPGIVVHPGYQLRVQTLGAFRAWRGQVEIEPRAWQRDKARQLFQLLLTHRDVWLHRDEIVDRLWPNLSPEAAGRDFKVALNALNRAIEPNRSADDPFAFIVRDGTAYQLRPDADLWLDAADFQRECEAGLRLSDSDAPVIDEAILHLQAGLQAYGGDYLPDALYEDWSSDERERLLSLYLRAADKLASLLFDRERYNEVLDVCQLILARDACWERAYRLMMLAHDRQGNRPLALRTYQRCANSLRHELGVEPSPATTHLYRSIAQAGEEPVTGV
jgi:DNA-binding SARP family transcriptional activator